MRGVEMDGSVRDGPSPDRRRQDLRLTEAESSEEAEGASSEAACHVLEGAGQAPAPRRGAQPRAMVRLLSGDYFGLEGRPV